MSVTGIQLNPQLSGISLCETATVSDPELVEGSAATTFKFSILTVTVDSPIGPVNTYYCFTFQQFYGMTVTTPHNPTGQCSMSVPF